MFQICKGFYLPFCLCQLSCAKIEKENRIIRIEVRILMFIVTPDKNKDLADVILCLL